MVRDGYYYGIGFFVGAALVLWLADWRLFPGLLLALPPLLMAAFFLWFFRDPERRIPQDDGLIVSPADGKVTEVQTVELLGEARTRISIFLNVFNVHVNRSPIEGVIEKIEYRRGQFRNAMGADCAELNEQNIVTLRGSDCTIIFKQVAGLLARRIVFHPRVGDRLARGQRVGMIKFGSRADLILPSNVCMQVKVGDSVQGGSSIIAHYSARHGSPSSTPGLPLAVHNTRSD